jgi:HSP20 family molecular chaperone IbpA
MGAKRGLDLETREGAAAPQVFYGDRLADFKVRIQEAIAHRAYEFYEARGRQDGLDLEDWFRSEEELLHPLKVNTWASANEITVTAEIPGFLAEEIEIGIEPRRVLIWGQVGPEPNRTSAYPTRAPIALFHSIDLPAAIDPPRASTKFTDGLLKLVLPKLDG